MLTRRETLALPLALLPAAAAAGPPAPTRIALGSCADQRKEQPVWEAVAAAAPDAFVFLGDNVYADTEDEAELRAAYAALFAKPGFAALRRRCEILATWDDHDYGLNDGGADFPAKAMSKRVFLETFGAGADDPRHGREGIYSARRLGPEGRVQVILLDLRWNLTPAPKASVARQALRRAKGWGPYEVGGEVLLGEAQWAWLEARLGEPAALRILASSLPVTFGRDGWERWANWPGEQDRLFRLLAATGNDRMIAISGDCHWGEISRLERHGATITELTASGLTQHWDGGPNNPNRLAGPYGRPNFGLIEIDWSGAEPRATLQVRSLRGDPVLSYGPV